MKTSKILISAGFLFLLTAQTAYAADGTIPWGNFLLRVLNVLIFFYIIYRVAGKQIKGFLIGRGDKIVTDMEDLEAKKKEAIAHLADVEKRIANIEEECANLLKEGKESAELLSKSIIEEAQKQAKAIVEQANKSAEQAIQSEITAIRAKIADEIVGEVRKNLEQNLDTKKHKDLIEASVAKVSGF